VRLVGGEDRKRESSQVTGDGGMGWGSGGVLPRTRGESGGLGSADAIHEVLVLEGRGLRAVAAARPPRLWPGAEPVAGKHFGEV
jgi:hypothetical protein